MRKVEPRRVVTTDELTNCGNGDPCDGGCIEAAIASITGIDVDAIPCTDVLHRDGDNWIEDLSRALWPERWAITWVDGEQPAPKGWSIAAGPDGDDGEDGHAVVAYDGEQVFDPSGDVGLAEVTTWYLVYKVVP